MGNPGAIERATELLHQVFDMTSQRDYPARKSPGNVMRYFKARVPDPPAGWRIEAWPGDEERPPRLVIRGEIPLDQAADLCGEIASAAARLAQAEAEARERRN